jgi:hypothetical protein
MIIYAFDRLLKIAFSSSKTASLICINHFIVVIYKPKHADKEKPHSPYKTNRCDGERRGCCGKIKLIRRVSWKKGLF